MRIVFSRDRAAQLDLLLRSLARYAPSDEETWILWYASDDMFVEGYCPILADEYESVRGLEVMTKPQHFDRDLRDLLDQDDTVTFFCDDDVVFRPLPYDPRMHLDENALLCFSWRLPGKVWDWTRFLDRYNHGYPGSIDGHTFRTADVLEMIGDEHIANPLILETVLALGCERLADRRPLMAAWPEQVLVGVPVNTVSDDTLRPNGQRHPQSAADLNDRFLAGGRIDLDALDFSDIDGCHHELEYVWRDG